MPSQTQIPSGFHLFCVSLILPIILPVHHLIYLALVQKASGVPGRKCLWHYCRNPQPPFQVPIAGYPTMDTFQNLVPDFSSSENSQQRIVFDLLKVGCWQVFQTTLRTSVRTWSSPEARFIRTAKFQIFGTFLPNRFGLRKSTSFPSFRPLAHPQL